ncbi:hypothetical protein VIGAN_UM045800 [Vigna angularis var. angularis]|uniref:Uncharacterized protein n=1 Tax=Vigna angularis var. angularis TaxID=157739 RepID=A0A0S3TDS1_PHAAN|nr:hypothetical protein VIGAN_UM045800 [Vigna angularis var. angularis]
MMEVEENTRALQREVPERSLLSRPSTLFCCPLPIFKKNILLLPPRIPCTKRCSSASMQPLPINKWQLDFQILLGPNQCFLCLLLAV